MTMEHARAAVAGKPKVVFVLGATATGKSKLAIALAKRFNGEVINADKIQVHAGAPIITNKVTEEEQDGVRTTSSACCRPTPSSPRRTSGARRSPPSPAWSPPAASRSSPAAPTRDGAAFRARHDVLFIWADAAPELLEWYVALRVDDMVARGLVAEARAAFDAAGAGRGDDVDYSRGLRRAIGLPEMHAYLVAEREGAGAGEADELAALLARAVREIKDNTCRLARVQVGKIRRLSRLDGWDVRRVDVTPVFARMADGTACHHQTWKTLVWEPCEEMVMHFLETPAAPTAFSRRVHHGDRGRETGRAVEAVEAA
ncbi:hypothetical protein EJB05_38214, partial [Eragrostis curvula]